MTETGHIRWNQAMKEETDGSRRERSWLTAVAVFTSSTSLFSRCLVVHRGKGERAQQKDVSECSSGTFCQAELITVYFITRTFKELRGRQSGMCHKEWKQAACLKTLRTLT